MIRENFEYSFFPQPVWVNFLINIKNNPENINSLQTPSLFLLENHFLTELIYIFSRTFQSPLNILDYDYTGKINKINR